jgi:perosamine synthetase
MSIRISEPNIGYREIYAVAKVLKSKRLVNSRTVKSFEDSFASFSGAKHCSAVNSGTSALHLGLLAMGIGKGDEVIIPAFSFAATANSVLLTGAQVVFADVNSRTFNIETSALESLVTSRTKAIIPVHLYGLPADMDPINRIAEKYGLHVFEDSAQAHGALYKDRPTGSLGNAAAFSFYATKNMTSGEGGAFTTSNPVWDRKIRLLRNQGMEKVYFNEIPGFNNRMTELQGALGLTQLSKLQSMNKKRRLNAQFFNKELRGVITPYEPENSFHVYHQYTLTLVDLERDSLIKFLSSKGIESKVYYPLPLHQLDYMKVDLPLVNSENLSKSVLSIPVHPKLRKSDLERIVVAVNAFASAGS